MIVFYYSHGGNTSRFVVDRLMPEILAAYGEKHGSAGRGDVWMVRIVSDGPRSPMSSLVGWSASVLPVFDQMKIPHPRLDEGVRQAVSEEELEGSVAVWGPNADKEKSIVVVPTYGSLHNGTIPEYAMPQAVQDLIEMVGADKFTGLVAMGNRNFGRDFAGAGAVTEIPLLAEVELAGNRHEAKIIAENLFAEKENSNDR